MELPAELKREMVATKEDMDAYRLPIHCRDYCAHVLIPLNACRKKNHYMPWKCEDEKHAFEVCQYEEYERRRKIKNWLVENNVDYKKEP